MLVADSTAMCAFMHIPWEVLGRHGHNLTWGFRAAQPIT